MEPMSPSVYRNARPKTVRIVSAVVIARVDNGAAGRGSRFGPPRAIASSVNQTVRLPRRLNAASYSGRFVTRYRGRGI
jgi:hypothetical protein